MRTLLPSVLAALLIAAPAHASVLCQKKSGAVVVRTACKKKESPLNLAALGGAARSGSINGDGTVQYVSEGVSVQRIGSGQYQLDFVPGTWPETGFVVMFSPLGGIVTGEQTTLNQDGSTTATVAFSNGDTVFLFVAVGT